jgi:hypothetical protein
MTVQTTCELVTYVPAGARADLLPSVRCDWPTADGALPVARLLAHVTDGTARARIRAAVRDFEARVLEVVRRDVLPPGDLIQHVVIVAGGGLELHGGREDLKLRIDESVCVAALRRRPLQASEGEDPLSRLRRELADVLAVPVGAEAAVASDLRDLDAVRAGALCVRLAPPDGLGYARGRVEALEAYADGRTLLVGWARPRYDDRCLLPQAAPSEEVDLGSLDEPKVGAPGTGAPPKRGALSRKWTPADDAAVAFNRTTARDRADAAVQLSLTEDGQAQDPRVDLGEWQAGVYDTKEAATGE